MKMLSNSICELLSYQNTCFIEHVFFQLLYISSLFGIIIKCHYHIVKIKEDGLDLFYFSFHFYFQFDLFFYFIFLEQLGLGLIGHTITSVT